MVLKRLLQVFFWPGIVLLGLAVGAGSALVMVRQASPLKGPWSAGLEVGSANADSYTRARVALCCLLALTRKEAVYYRADRDSGGKPLRANCLYRVFGRRPDARWWSLTVYGSDFFLIETKYGRYSVNSGTVKVSPQGDFSVLVGPQPSQGAWLPTRGKGRIHLLLRAYNPSAALAANPEAAALPTINRAGKCL